MDEFIDNIPRGVVCNNLLQIVADSAMQREFYHYHW
jgi:hypothetical protein